MVNKQMKECFISLKIREVKINSTMKYNKNSTELLMPISYVTPTFGEDVEL